MSNISRRVRTSPRTERIRLILATATGRAGAIVISLVLMLSFVGPHIVPYSPTLTTGAAYETSSLAHLFGTDAVGRDIVSRVLSGGVSIIAIAAVATALAYVVAIPLGMAAGMRHDRVGDVIAMAVVDVALAFPPIVLVLGLLAAAGSGFTIVVIGIACVHVPRILRVVRTVTIELSEREFVEAAVARGERLWSILFREIMPNIWTPTLADFGLRLTGSIVLYTSLSYLGLAEQPPAANWGLMVSENRNGLFINPLGVLMPVALVAVLGIGANLVADAFARSIGRSVVDARL